MQKKVEGHILPECNGDSGTVVRGQKEEKCVSNRKKKSFFGKICTICQVKK